MTLHRKPGPFTMHTTSFTKDFVAPLLPDETATLCLTGAAPEGSRARFEIRRDGCLLARGVVEGSA